METRRDRDAQGRSRLPVRLTRFIGREREIADLVRLLSETRLLTLVGAPGIGKTRLALQVASTAQSDFAENVWLVELAGLSEPDLLPGAVASALGVVDQPARSMVDTLAEHIRSRRLLLVIDNCEHLVASCAALVEALLHACPDLHVLATSREALRIEGETTWRVPSLSAPSQKLPDPGRPALGAELLQFEAVQLFVDRARAVQPSFALTDQNASAVAQICHRLDGIPLAIELAAARLDGLSSGQIAARLDDHFGLLSSGSRTALPRQQTLRGAIDWSYDLLSREERTLARRLAVFAGGWTLDAAEGVCGDRVLEPLLGLVGRSMVLTQASGGETRYRLLEMIRQYCWAKLAEAGELDAIRDRHRDWFLALVEQAEPNHIFGPHEATMLARLEAEHDNLRAALTWCEQRTGGGEAGLRLAGALWGFWYLRGHLGEGRRWLDRMVARTKSDPASERGEALARALSGTAQLAGFQGDFRRASALTEEAMSIWREMGNRRMIAWSLNRLGHHLGHQHQIERALALCEESVMLSRELSDEPVLAQALLLQGNLLVRSGDYGRAITVEEECLALFRKLGYTSFAMYALGNIGVAATALGEYERAETMCAEALSLARQLGHPRGIADTAKHLGGLKVARTDGPGAARLFGESLSLFRDLGDQWGVSEIVEWMGAVACVERSWEQAARLFGAAESMREALDVVINRPVADHDRDVAAVRSHLGEAAFTVRWTAGRAMSAAQAIEDALDLSRSVVSGDSGHAMAAIGERSGPTSRTGPLTPREREVAALIAQGFTNRQIAADLVISERTVDGHVAKILSKLRFATRAQIAVWATHRQLGRW